MIKDYFKEGFDIISFIFSVVLGLMLMLSFTGYHTWYAVILFLMTSTGIIMIVDILFYQLLERGDLIG